jgi:hypothetical protein
MVQYQVSQAGSANEAPKVLWAELRRTYDAGQGDISAAANFRGHGVLLLCGFFVVLSFEGFCTVINAGMIFKKNQSIMLMILY